MQQNPIFNNIKRLNIETIKQDNTSFIKNDVDVENIIERVTKNKKNTGLKILTQTQKKLKKVLKKLNLNMIFK